MHGETILLITQNEDLAGLEQDEHNFSTDCAVQMYPCESTDAADTVMGGISTYNIDTDNCRAYSGAIFSVKEIPANMKGLTPYIIINVIDGHDVYGDTMEGVFKKLPKDIDKVCDKITEVLSTKVRIELDDGYLYDNYPNIDDVYLFLGKQIELSLTVSADSVDEEIIDRIDSICDDVLDGKSIVIGEHYTQNTGDDEMTSNDVVMTVNQTEATSKSSAYKITGRLIGICDSEEAVKIAYNKEAALRVHTKASTRLTKIVSLLNEHQVENHKKAMINRKAQHVVMTIKEIKDLKTSTEATACSRKLYISPPIDFVSSNSASKSLSSATLDCTDGSMCSIMENLE
jgi:hypothetical protein